MPILSASKLSDKKNGNEIKKIIQAMSSCYNLCPTLATPRNPCYKLFCMVINIYKAL